MKTSWQPVPSDRPGVSQFRKSGEKCEAWIERRADGSAVAGETNGFFGPRVEGWFRDPAPADEVILQRLEDTAHPPRFGNWKEVPEDAPSVKHFEGRETGGLIRSKVDVFVTRVGDEVDYTAQVGHFGTHIEGHYFAPAPSDQEILRRLSRP